MCIKASSRTDSQHDGNVAEREPPNAVDDHRDLHGARRQTEAGSHIAQALDGEFLVLAGAPEHLGDAVKERFDIVWSLYRRPDRADYVKDLCTPLI